MWKIKKNGNSQKSKENYDRLEISETSEKEEKINEKPEQWRFQSRSESSSQHKDQLAYCNNGSHSRGKDI